MKGICRHFGICGGCDFQDMEYEEQLKAKEWHVKDIFAPFGVRMIEKIVPSPEIFYYRNKMEYAVSRDMEDVVIGLRQKKRFYRTVDIEECRIFFDRVKDIFDIFKGWMRANNIEPYHLKRYSGNIRYAAMRHSKYYNEMMVIVVLNSEEGSLSALVDGLKKHDAVKSVYLCVNNGMADVSMAGELTHLYGATHIKERVNGIDYLVGPDSFFQTNPYCCGRLYQVLADRAGGLGGAALDMCCGSGGITLQLSDNFSSITGVDISEKNIINAELNRRMNKKDNVEFIRDDAENFLMATENSGKIKEFSAIVLDPPRAGLSKRAKEALCSKGAENIFYVSCNPVNMALDLRSLTQNYRIEEIVPVDMFPHTKHIEVVAILKRDKV